MASNSVEILIRARDGATKTLEEVRAGVKGVGDAARAGLKDLRDYQTELEHQARALEDVARQQDESTEEYRKTVAELARVKGELGNVTDELVKQASELDRQTAALDQHAVTWEQTSKRIGGSMTSLGTKLSLGVTAPLTALAGIGVQSVMQLEMFSESLKVLVGDAEAANEVFDQLYEFSANTPFDWKTLTEGTRVLAAFGTEAEDIVPTLSALGDIAAGVQTPLNQLAEIYGRVQLTGRLGMEEVNRLAERGIPIYTELAKQLGVSESQVRDLVSTGVVGFPELEAVITSLTTEGGMFFGMMDAQSKTVQGRLNALKDTFEQVTDIIGEHLVPAFDAMIGAAQSAVDWFVNLDESTQGLFVGLGVALSAAGPLLVGFGTLLAFLPQLVTGFGLLRAAMLPFLGPVGLAASLAIVLATLGTRFVTADKALETHRDWIDEAASAYAAYRGEIHVTTEAERTAAIERLATTRAEMQERIKLLQDLASQQKSSVQGFLNSPIGKFLMPGFVKVEGSAGYGTLDEIERLGEVVSQIGSDIDKLVSGASRVVEVEVNVNNPPPVDVDVTFTGDGAELVKEPAEAGRSWAATFVEQLSAGLNTARAGWRDALTGFGVLTGGILRDAFGVDQPESPLVTLGKDIVGSIADGIEQAFPSFFTRLSAGVQAIKGHVADEALTAWVASGSSLMTPTTPVGPLGRDSAPFIPDLIGIGGRPIPGDVAGFEGNIAQMSEAMFGPRSAAGRFLVDLEALFQRAAREMARADRVASYEGNRAFYAGQAARFDDAGTLAYHNRVIFDPRSSGFVRDIPQPGGFAGLPAPRDIGDPGAFAVLPAPVDLTGFAPSANVMPDRSHLPTEQLDELLRKEMEARQAVVDGLTTMSSEKGPLANFGAQLLNAAAEAVPAFGAALDGFVQAGPMGAVIAFFTELLMASEPMQEAFVMINEALAPLGELLGRIIAPALKLLGTVIGWVVDALVAVYNALLGWLFGRIEDAPPPPPKDDELKPPPRVHGGGPPARQEMNFGQISPAVQMAVATPLVEAAMLSLSAAQLQVTAANSLQGVLSRLERMYERVLDEGFKVTVNVPTSTTQVRETAYLR